MINTPRNRENDITGATGSAGRLLSLDALRGTAVLLMLLVNNLGTGPGISEQFRHASWTEPIHLADLAFPWFLLCVGLAIPFSSASWAGKGFSRRDVWTKVLRRVAILLLLGAVFDTYGDWQLTIFSVGILQTIALSYLVAVSLRRLSNLERGAVAFVLLLGYWAAIQLVPFPGKGQFSEEHNLIRYVNETFLGGVGLWGLPRLIPTSALVLIGTCVADYMRDSRLGNHRKALGIVVAGIAITTVSFLWGMDLPFNKWIWTSSYVLLSAGLGISVLGVFFFLSEALNWKKIMMPLVVLGSNAILAYLLPTLMKGAVLTPLHIYMGGWGSVLAFILFWWLVFWWLYRARIFLNA